MKKSEHAIAAYESAKPALPAPVAELITKARGEWNDWIRRLDYDPDFSTPAICEWINERPAAAFIVLGDALESLSRQLNEAEAKVGELERERNQWKERAADREHECERRARKQWDAEAKLATSEYWFKQASDGEIRNRERAEAAEARIASLAGALGETASGQVKYWRDSQIGKPCLDDAINDAGEHTPLGDSAAWDAGYLNGRYSEADWWQRKITDLCALASVPAAVEKEDGPLEEARAIIKGFMGCAEIGDCDPRDKDPETRDLESRAQRFINAGSRSPDLITDAATREWLPIESAPKNGTIVDLWCGELGRWPDCFWGFPDHSCGESGQYCDSDWHGLQEGWVCSTWNEPCPEGPTHWMPRPASPKGGES